MAANKFIIEMRVNEYAMRDGNRNVPWTPEEIATAATECRAAGATIVHFHARKPDGSPDHSYETYRKTIGLIRERSDILIHTTLGAFSREGDAQARLDYILRLADEGMAPDFGPLDMGSTNVDMFDAATLQFRSDDQVYLNTTGTLLTFADGMRGRGIKPYAMIWNIPTLRLADAFLDMGRLKEPLLLGLGLTEGGLIAAHPGTIKGLRAYLDFLPEGRDTHWTVALACGNILPLVGEIAALGGHVSAGLGDDNYLELGHPTNADVTGRIVELARAAGREPATPAEAKQMLAM